MQRLRTRQQFQSVLAGATVARTSHFVLHKQGVGFNQLEPAAPDAVQLPGGAAKQVAAADEAIAAPFLLAAGVWIGAMAPKRWARRAVTRNTIKRQIYTVSADLQHLFPQAAWLVRLRREFARAEFPSATSDALRRAVRAELVVLFETGLRAR